MSQAKKLNSMRLLEQHKIPYEALYYDDGEFHSAEEVADMLGVPYHLIFKTLVIQSAKSPSSKPYLAVIPSNHTLSLKKFAAAANEKKVQMAAHKDAEMLTGLQVGGISTLALTHKNWGVYLSNTATDHEHLMMSGGQRGVQLRVPTSAFIRLVNAKIADISDEG